MNEHIIEAIGKTPVKICDGKVVEVGESEIDYCPLFHKYHNMEKITSDAVKENIQYRIDDFGMCTGNRQIRMKDFLSFGISEILCTLLDEGIIDCVVMVCEGCGTVIIDEAEMVQGIGGRVSGLVKTSPIPDLIEKIGVKRVLDPSSASINQLEGIKKSISLGYRNIAVTLAGFLDTTSIEDEHPEVNVYKFGVHTTGLSEDEALKIVESFDIVTSCASKYIRKYCDDKSVFSVGEEIPIYALTGEGELFLKLRLDKIGGPKPPKLNPRLPDPLI